MTVDYTFKEAKPKRPSRQEHGQDKPVIETTGNEYYDNQELLLQDDDDMTFILNYHSDPANRADNMPAPEQIIEQDTGLGEKVILPPLEYETVNDTVEVELTGLVDQLDETETPDKDAVNLIDNASEDIPPLRKTTRTRRRPKFYSNSLNVIQEKSWKEWADYLLKE